MKSRSVIVFIIALVLLSGCTSGNREKNMSPGVEVTDTVFEASNAGGDDSSLYIKNRSLLWQVDDQGLTLQKPKVPGIDTMSVKNIIHLINDNYDSIHVDYIKTSHDTVYVHIPHSEMLTERIGSTGAEIFMASTTYSLTELKGIKYVNYDFEEGDHATPGVYDRDSFRNFQ